MIGRSFPVSWRLLVSLAVVVLVTAASLLLVTQAAPRIAFGLDLESRDTPDVEGLSQRVARVDTPSLNDVVTGGAGDRWLFWTGYIQYPAAGIKGFELSSSGFAELYIDGQPVVRTRDGEQQRRGVPNGGGTHRIRVFYRHAGLDPAIELRWVTMSDDAERIPDHAFAPGRILPGFAAARARPALTGTVLAVVWLMTAGALFAAWFGPPILRCLELTDIVRDRPLRIVLACVLLLTGYPIWWGLSVGGYWAMDEIGPASVLHGLQTSYVDGWFDKYPPLHYYLTNVVLAPFFVAERLAFVRLLEPPAYPAQMLVARALSLVMGLGTVVVVFVCAADLFGRRAAVLAALVWGVTLPLAFHIKVATVDVPYTFWFALSLLAYLRIVRRGAGRDYLLFAAMAALAVCTKDQAYGLYALPVAHAVWLRVTRLRAPAAALPRIMFDPVLVSACCVGLGLFAVIHNLFFNMQGFTGHMELITGGASESYRVYENTIGGHARLLANVVVQFGWSMSVPLAVAAAAGVLLKRRPDEASFRWLLLPAVSYYLSFIAVVGYCYDRFLLPVCLIAACVAGRALARMLDATVLSRWMVAAVSMVMVFAAWRAASVGMLMAADSRHAATIWLRQNVPPGASIGAGAPLEYLPSLPGEHIVWMPLDRTAGSVDADFLAVNVEFGQRYEPGSPQARWYRAVADGTAGYDLVYSVRAAVPLAILTREETYRRAAWFTVIGKLNPDVRIYRRRGR